MAGPYRNNKVMAAGYSTTTFSPPLDAIYVTVNAGANVNMTISGTATDIPQALLTAGTLLEVGDISQVNAATSFAFIGLRVMNKSGSSNVTNDVSG
jgi:hypothetical protein